MALPNGHKSSPRRRRGGRLVVACVLVGSLGPLAALLAQLPAGTRAKGFQFPIYDGENRLNCFVRGGAARTLPGGLIEIEQLQLQTYKPDGQADFVVEAPHCTFDPQRRTASSPGALQARTADERLAIRGEGFSWSQADGRLVISNRVQTVLRPSPSTNLLTKP
jgi:hypothetical protein